MKTPDSFIARLCKTLVSNFTSRKFLMTGFALWVEWAVYWAVVQCIYTFDKPEQLTAFVSITQHFQWTITTMLLAYLGVQTAANFSNTATQTAQNLIQNSATNVKSETKHTEVIIDETAKNENLRHYKEEE